MDQRDDRSFRFDRTARSFRPSDFGLGDVPWLVLAFVAVLGLFAGAAYVLDPIVRLVPSQWRPVILGFVAGFLAGLRVSDWGARRSKSKVSPPLESDA